MVSNIICPVIMQKRYLKELQKNTSLLKKEQRNLNRKLNVWLLLPYRVRLRIEHFCFVANLIIENSYRLQKTPLLRIRLWYLQRFSIMYKEILKLKTHWYHSTPVVFAKSDNSVAMSNFLDRVSSINHF